MGNLPKYIAVFLVGCGVGFLVTKSASRPPHENPKQQVSQPTPQKRSLTGGEHLGIQSGDILVSVNGVKNHSMFQELESGYQRGDVCVVFIRDNQNREICLKKVPETTAQASQTTNPQIDPRLINPGDEFLQVDPLRENSQQ